MQRRELFKWVASSTVLAATSFVTTTSLVAATALVGGSGCQREPAPSPSFVGGLRKHAMPDTIEPAFSFRPLPQPAR